MFRLGRFPVKSLLVGFLTFLPLLCSQAWDPAESPGECPSSPAAPSTSPWAGRAPRARGGAPGLRRWGAGGPRRLLQRSERHTDRPTHTAVICPGPLLPLCTSVAQTMAGLSHTVCGSNHTQSYAIIHHEESDGLFLVLEENAWRGCFGRSTAKLSDLTSVRWKTRSHLCFVFQILFIGFLLKTSDSPHKALLCVSSFIYFWTFLEL